MQLVQREVKVLVEHVNFAGRVCPIISLPTSFKTATDSASCEFPTLRRQSNSFPRTKYLCRHEIHELQNQMKIETLMHVLHVVPKE